MIMDPYAVIAMLRDEADAARYAPAIELAEVVRLSAGNYLEIGIVVDSGGDAALRRRFDDLVREAEIVITPVTETQARIARQAYRDFGRGSGHAARLNFGDCFAYALAKAMNDTLLFKGHDFSHTDITSAL